MLQKGKVTFPVSNSWYFPAFYMGNGGTMFGAKGTDAKAGVNFPDAAAVTAYLAKLVATRTSQMMLTVQVSLLSRQGRLMSSSPVHGMLPMLKKPSATTMLLPRRLPTP